MFFFQMKVPPQDSEVLASFLGTSTWHDLLASSKRMVFFLQEHPNKWCYPLKIQVKQVHLMKNRVNILNKYL